MTAPKLGINSKSLAKKRERAEAVLIMLRRLLSRIDTYISRLEEREKQLFNKVVELTSMGDNTRAAIIASEISQIRSILRHLTALRYIIEGIELKIENYLAIGYAMESIGPAAEALKEIRSVFKGLIPTMEVDIQNIEGSLREIILDSEGSPVHDISYTPYASQEAKRILEEAYSLAEKRLRESFPSVSSDLERKSKQ